MPHRQFRNKGWIETPSGRASMPHRQFRKRQVAQELGDLPSMPHRQFRKIGQEYNHG